MNERGHNPVPHVVLTCAVVAILALGIVPHGFAAQAQEALALEDDVRALTQHPHRLSGTDPAHAAADHIVDRLEAMGIDQRFELEMPVWQTEPERCEMVVGDERVALEPMRPNVIAPPVTPKQGITAPLRYLGDGALTDYGDESIEGQIVALEYDSGNNWERAFAMGAKAVIFLGDESATPIHPRHAGIPANQVRLYAGPEQQARMDLRRDREEVTLHSRIHWRQRVGRNIVARIPGTDPGFASDRAEREVLVLAVHYDTFGVVPRRSPGARSAANVAGMLALAERLYRDPPRRDVLLLFLDNQARHHQGARTVYDALMMSDGEAADVSEAHDREQTFIEHMHRRLAEEGLRFDTGGRVGTRLFDALEAEAENARAAINEELHQLRLLVRDHELMLEQNDVPDTGVEAAADPATLEAEIAEAEAEIDHLDAMRIRWDTVRRAIHVRAVDELVDEHEHEPEHETEDSRHFKAIFEELERRTLDRFDRRLAELAVDQRVDQQRVALRDAVGDHWIVLHATLDFSDGATHWAPVVGDWTHALIPAQTLETRADNPGFYGRMMDALGDAAEALPTDHALDQGAMRNYTMGRLFAPGRFVSSGSVAGTHGIYNVTLMTGHDARVRDGHPADTLAALDLSRLARQIDEAGVLLRAAASSAGLSMSRVFTPQVETRRTGWSTNHRPRGDYAGMQLTGGLAEDRPAAGALMAVWPATAGGAGRAEQWRLMSEARRIAHFDPMLLERVNAHGRFQIVGVRRDAFDAMTLLGAMFDDAGHIRATTAQRELNHDRGSSFRVDLFPSRGFTLANLNTHDVRPQLLRVLRATANAPFRPTQTLYGQQGRHSFFYIPQTHLERNLKLFQPFGAIVLNATAENPVGDGMGVAALDPSLRLGPIKSRDLWVLNEDRLGRLRQRGIQSGDLEWLNSRALAALDRAEAASDVATEEARHQRSAALSQRAYHPLRQTMDDLVHAIVILLLLAIPFAFALERLLIGATTVYGRIGGFAATFIATFAAMFFLHPGFAIATTPALIFLAFAIIVLASLVIHIVVRKFNLELKALQGQAVNLHDVTVSRAGTLLAAVGMGISTMRRRPTRTFLTAMTVVILTFTILGFASFDRVIGVRAVYSGPVTETMPRAMLLRQLDFAALPVDTLALLADEARIDSVVGHWWHMPEEDHQRGLSLARPDTGGSQRIEAVMGVSQAKLEAWGELGNVLEVDPEADVAEVDEALAAGGIFLPSILVEALDLTGGDRLLVDGREAWLAGTVDEGRLQRLRHLDGEPILPVDFRDPMDEMMEEVAAEEPTDVVLTDDVMRQVRHFTPSQVVVAPSDLVRRLGGAMHAVTIFPEGEADLIERGRELAEVVVMPVWAAGPDGVERLSLSVLTEVAGGMALFVPVLLGGLIIFSTLLGSISDREREIYTFSALGLSPQHVGVLFFAEATVYAVVGGLGGQLLAQAMAVGATQLAQLGWIEPPQMNYSSTNALFAIGVVMATVLISAIYPAHRASRSANPGLARTWRMPAAEGDDLRMTFPFTVSAYDITGVVSFLAEHFRRHADAGLGRFAASDVCIRRDVNGCLELSAHLALAPFDLGVTQHLTLTARESEIEGVDEVSVHARRLSGARSDWQRGNRTFVADVRRQFLLWRTLSNEMIEYYRMQTLETLSEQEQAATAEGPAPTRTPEPTAAKHD